MGILFGRGGGKKTERLFHSRVNQSVYGLPIPAVMGTAQVQQSLLWEGGFKSKKAPSGDKGKGGSTYLYSEDAVVALCNGPILGIGDIWNGQSWLGLPSASETYTISGTGVYTPVNAAQLAIDQGAGMGNAYDTTFNDYRAPGSNRLTGNDYVPLRRMPVGSTLSTGQYYVDSSGNYHFNNTTDLGKTINIPYSYVLTSINQQENDIVPATLSIQVGGTFKFLQDFGVRYAAGPNVGNSLTSVNGTPTAAGTYSFSGSAPATYRFAPADIGAQVTITYQIKDQNAVPQGQSQTLNFTLNTGTAGQAPFAYLSSTYPQSAFGYTSIATLLFNPMDLGASATLPQYRYEVVTPDVYGGGIKDCNPVTCLTQVLTNQQWGLGVGPVPFPVSAIDNGTNGTWGAASPTPGVRTTNTTAWNWFAANNFFISPVIESQSSAAGEAGKWLEAGMCAAYYSEGLLKLVPHGDTSAAANGVTWQAPSSAVVALDDTTFLAQENEDPVRITRISTHDAWNAVMVSWENRLNQYAAEITQESDQALIQRYGERRESPQTWNFIKTLAAATFAANMRLKHGSYVRSAYEFSLPYSYSYLEPMDIVTISTSSQWAAGLNNIGLGITNLPVRIKKIVDDSEKGLQITAEDYSYGAHLPVIYNKQIAAGNVQVNSFADPGDSTVIFFEALSSLTGFSGNQIWFGGIGTSVNYGYTNVWVSTNGQRSYSKIGSIIKPAKMGVLHSVFPVGSDPDTVNNLVVDLTENTQPLTAGSNTDADLGNTLCYVDGEIISYSTLSTTGQNQITMSSYTRRGQKRSAISSHAIGSNFLLLDDAVFKFTYDPAWAGKTLYFKFQSVNSFNNSAQPMANLNPIAFVVPGKNPGTVDASSGLVINAGPQVPVRPGADPLTRSGWIGGAGPLSWTPSA